MSINQRDRTTMTSSRFGLSAALSTPFAADGAIDYARLAAHAGWCLAHGCDSVTPFGTTGEGASIGPRERERVVGALASAGIEGRRVVGGVATAAIEEAVDQIRIALDFGCRALLLPPPFYFKGVGDDGLFAWFASVFEKLGPAARDVILYNIPPLTQVPLSVRLVERLASAFPEVVIGVKDSSGDWPYTERLLAACGDLTILVGDERHLAAAVRLGGSGAISGVANLLPGRLRSLAIDGTDDPHVIRFVEAMVAYPVIPAIKALLAAQTGETGWLRVRPPLVPLTASEFEPLKGLYDTTFAARAA
jgi:4-hydroxy-tetrahydrodipicolinate synthase